MTTKQRMEAAPAYESAHMVARDLIDRLTEMLGDMPAPDGETPIHWGHVGSVAHVNARLAELIEHLGGAK